MSDKEKNQLHAELRILESLRHPNIVQYCHREHLKSSHDLHLYMEYCGNGDLGGYIKKLKDRNQYADEEFVWSIFAQLISALYRCHYGEDPPKVGEEGKVRNGKAVAFQTKEGHRMILHRDLKPENGKLNLSTSSSSKCTDESPQSSLARTILSSWAISACPRLSRLTTLPRHTWARLFICHQKSVPRSVTAIIPTSGV
jgi:serine/threonine protein kinase